MADSNSRTPDRRDVDRLAKAQQSAVTQARSELRKVFETVYNMYDDPADMRDALLDLVPAIAQKYGDAGSVAAGEWYEQMRAKWFKDQMDIDTTYQPDDKAMRETIRRLAGHLWDGKDGSPADPDAMLRGLLANMDKWVKAGGRETIERASRRDPRRPRYARVPQGAKTCAFCAMLAGRGFVYSSAEAAGAMSQYHKDCDCEIIPSWDKKNPNIEGYDPDKLYDAYLKTRNRLGKETATLEEILEAMRHMGGYTDSTTTIPFGLPPVAGRAFSIVKGRTSLADAAQHSNRIDKARDGDNAYLNNCQRCVVASELRRRGYDVIARPAWLTPGGKPDPSDPVASNWAILFKNTKWKSSRDKAGIDKTINDMPEGARGTVYLEWNPRYKTGAHVFRFEKTRTGIRYYDPQTGWIGCDSYFNHRRPGTWFFVARTDNLDVDERFIDDIIEEREQTEEA